MKKIFIFTILVFKGLCANGQSCNVLDEFNSNLTHTITQAEYESFPWYNDSTFLNNYYQTLISQFGGVSARTDIESVWLRVPIVFWVYRDDNGGAGNGDPLPNELRLQRIIDDANNSHFNNSINFRYYIKEIKLVNNSSWVVPSNRIQRIQIALNNRIPNTMNVHIVNGGGSEFFWDTNAIFIERSVYLSTNAAETFTHEIGHYFGLLHTHFGFNVPCLREPVSRGTVVNPCPPFVSKRCRHTGDLLCDTPADPNMSEGTSPSQLPSNNNCTYVRGQTDFYGNTYQPDVANYMAYGNFGCSEVFSDGQKKVMNWFAFARGLAGETWLPTESNSFDRFEPDDADIAARPVPFNSLQEHSFHSAGRADNADWYRFQFASTNSVITYRIEVGDVGGHANPVNEINVYLRESSGSAGARLTGLTTFIQNGKRIVEIPCSLLSPNVNYLIEITRGSTFGRYTFLLKGSESLQILGTNPICGSSTFNIQNLPAGTPVAWSSSNPSVLSINSNTGLATQVGASFGQVTITANVGASCAQLVRTVWVGTPNPPTDILKGSGAIAVGATVPFSIEDSNNLNTGPVTYDWDVTGGYFAWIDSYAYTTITEPYLVLYAAVRNGCGPSGMISRGWSAENPGGCPPGEFCEMSVFPNPSSSEFTVSLPSTNRNKSSKIKLADSNGTLVYTTTVLKDVKQITIPAKDLKSGVYYLSVIQGEFIQQKQLIIK